MVSCDHLSYTFIEIVMLTSIELLIEFNMLFFFVIIKRIDLSKPLFVSEGLNLMWNLVEASPTAFK